MSFISKLFRRTDAEETAEVVTAQPAEEEATTAANGRTEAVVEAEADGPAEEPGAKPPPSEGGPTASESDIAWWEESTPPAMPAGQARPDVGARAKPGSVQPAEGSAVQALASSAQATAQEEDGGTRQLTAADAPTLAALRSHRGLAAAALRDIGRVRQVNQDSVFALVTTLPRESSDISMGLFIVADGMGGHHGGEIASRMAIGTVAHYVLSELVVPALTDGATEALQPLIVAAVQEAGRAIWEHAQLVGSDMGTTCTVALLLGRALYIGHVGDSRAYLATATELRQITDDHSTVGRLIKLGQLDPVEAREHPLRSQLYRTIGQQPEVQVDFIYQQVSDATHLLMCSDGLWGMLGDEVMRDVLEHSIWPQDACHELIARANLAGGDDNISAIIVSLPAQ